MSAQSWKGLTVWCTHLCDGGSFASSSDGRAASPVSLLLSTIRFDDRDTPYHPMSGWVDMKLAALRNLP